MEVLNKVVIIGLIAGALLSKVKCQPSSLQIEQSSSACHGSYSDETLVNATCNDGHVIAINRVILGSKLESIGCPWNYNDSYGFSTCCTYDKGSDCLFSLYSGNYVYHDGCNGKSTCIKQTQPTNTPTSCAQGNFTSQSRYMFMEYFCIEENKTVEMCSATTSVITKENTTVYIWNTDFRAQAAIDTSDTSCNCSVEIDNCDAYINMHKIYRILTGNGNGMCNQTIRIGSGENSTILYEWTCDDNKQDIESFTTQVTYLLLNLENSRNETDGKVWLGFEATDNSNITVSCPPTSQQYCMQTTTSTTTTTSSTTTENVTTTTTTAATATTTEPSTLTSTLTSTSAQNSTDKYDNFAIVIILAVILAVMLIVVIVLSCCLFRTCHTSGVNDVEKVSVQNKPSLQKSVVAAEPVLGPNLKDFACQVQFDPVIETKTQTQDSVSKKSESPVKRINEIRIQWAEFGCQVNLTESNIINDLILAEEKSTQTQEPSVKYEDKGVSTEVISQSTVQCQTDRIKQKSQKSQANVKTKTKINVTTSSCQTDNVFEDATRQTVEQISIVSTEKTPIKSVLNGNIQAISAEKEAVLMKSKTIIVNKPMPKKKTRRKKKVSKTDDELDFRNLSPDSLDSNSVDIIRKESPTNRRFLFTPETEECKPETELSKPITDEDSDHTNDSDTEGPDTYSREVRPIRVKSCSPEAAAVEHVYNVRNLMTMAFFSKEKNEEKLLRMINRQSKKKRVKKRKDSSLC